MPNDAEEVTFDLFPEQVRLMTRIQQEVADPKQIMDVLQQIKEGLIQEMQRYRYLEKHQQFNERIKAEILDLKPADR